MRFERDWFYSKLEGNPDLRKSISFPLVTVVGSGMGIIYSQWEKLNPSTELDGTREKLTLPPWRETCEEEKVWNPRGHLDCTGPWKIQFESVHQASPAANPTCEHYRQQIPINNEATSSWVSVPKSSRSTHLSSDWHHRPGLMSSQKASLPPQLPSICEPTDPILTSTFHLIIDWNGQVLCFSLTLD